MEPDENKGFVYEFGRFVLDPQEKTLFADGVSIHLPAKEFETLVLLVEHNGKALTKDEMMSAIWPDAFVEESNLAKKISRLRKLLNSNGEQYIETLPKRGYRFSADLRLIYRRVEEPVILEKRTVKRVTFAVENEIEPERPALPAPKPSTYKFPLLVVLSVVLIGLSYLAWRYGEDIVSYGGEAVDPYAPVRLTDNPNHDTAPIWSRDGAIRFWRVYPDKRSESWIMNGDGTGQSIVNTPDGRNIFSWSPDEQKVLFFKQGEPNKVYLSGADGSGETLVPIHGGSWSPDSKMIVYASRISWDNFDIFVYSIETGTIRNLTNSESFEADPSFSPDGNQVAFSGNQDGNQEIYSVNLDGSSLRRLTFDPAFDNHPAFSPDGTQILFTSDRENENTDVYVMNADGSGLVKMTNWDKSFETAGLGSWSPDGTKIAFFSDRNGKDDIYVVSAETVRPKLVFSEATHDIKTLSYSPDGKKIAYATELEDKSGELRILDLETGETNLIKKTGLASISPDWSPDGDWIAFHDRTGGNSEVYIIRPDGSDLRNLTNSPLVDIGPSWSPDGKRLAFLSGRGEGSNLPQLYVMNADGSDTRPITPRKGWEGDPGWSPDGSRIVFICDRQDSPGNALDVCQINADGSGEQRLLFHRGHDGRPVVSPDGNRIAFTATGDHSHEIYLMNRDGSGLLRLTRDPADDQSPEWSPDGTKLLFLSNRTGSLAIYEITF